MSDPDGTLARIDADLEAWETGPDAYRWDGDAEPGEQRGTPPRPPVDQLAQLGIPTLTQAEIDRIGEQLRAALEGFRISVAALARSWEQVQWPKIPNPLATRSGVGNSSGDQESTGALNGAQNGTQGLPGASQPNRNPRGAQ